MSSSYAAVWTRRVISEPSSRVSVSLDLRKARSWRVVAVMAFTATMQSPAASRCCTSGGASARTSTMISRLPFTSSFSSRPMSEALVTTTSLVTPSPPTAGPPVASITSRSTVKARAPPTSTAFIASTTSATVDRSRPLMLWIWSPTRNLAFTSSEATSPLIRCTVMERALLDSIRVSPRLLGFCTCRVSISVRTLRFLAMVSSASRATVSSMVVPSGWCFTKASSISEQSFRFWARMWSRDRMKSPLLSFSLTSAGAWSSTSRTLIVFATLSVSTSRPMLWYLVRTTSRGKPSLALSAAPATRRRPSWRILMRALSISSWLTVVGQRTSHTSSSRSSS
mmetsp:Transcript_1635/g.2582  ORF Transcript_1635/g.2582 Transcript_1635/m.2582 type:complete len:339 (+) Transcript_1635:301-1317(+)